MAHECQDCGQECYCDMDDCGGLPMPSDCPHIFCVSDDDDFDEDFGDECMTCGAEDMSCGGRCRKCWLESHGQQKLAAPPAATATDDSNGLDAARKE
jgi:hypothetical protein